MSVAVTHIVAKTHTAEYAIHKYWSRKPHNVIREIFKHVLAGKQCPVVVDPFCGSGVTLSEAARLGADVFGADLNPIAALLSSVTCSPPDPVVLESTLNLLVSEFEEAFQEAYRLPTGDEIRYVVHALAVSCQCGIVLTQEETRKSGRLYLCPSCGNRLSFNVQHNIATRVLQIRTCKGAILRLSSGGAEAVDCERQQYLSSVPIPGIAVENYDPPLIPNGRVLAFPGMTVGDLFTKRAFCAAVWLFTKAAGIQNDDVRRAAQVFLTSTVAQFSRLIPFRNELTTGGPAWTVPGFWVAPIHLETNPVVHLRARKEKFLKGIARLAQHKNASARARVVCEDALVFLTRLQESNVHPDVIFLDPPYGDSVPYLEFSAIWNAMLRLVPCYDKEIVVSNRTEYPADEATYADRLGLAIRRCAELISPTGRILVTFNNLEYTAWHALLRPIRQGGLRCLKVHYQVPAVVSAKAQFSPGNSYQGDFYCLFGRDNELDNPVAESVDSIRAAGLRVLKSRGGVAPVVLVQRAAILAVLRDNLNPDILLQMEQVLGTFAVREGQQYALRSSISAGGDLPLIGELIRSVASDRLKGSAELEWDELYKCILDATEDYGVPSAREARDALVELLEPGPRCRMKVDSGQGVLFA